MLLVSETQVVECLNKFVCNHRYLKCGNFHQLFSFVLLIKKGFLCSIIRNELSSVTPEIVLRMGKGLSGGRKSPCTVALITCQLRKRTYRGIKGFTKDVKAKLKIGYLA